MYFKSFVFLAVPWLELTASTFLVFENQSSVVITISRSGDLGDTGSFRLKTIQNTALSMFASISVLTRFLIFVCSW